jgi:outer membrane protein
MASAAPAALASSLLLLGATSALAQPAPAAPADATPAPPVSSPAPVRSMSLPDAIAYARAHQPAVLAGIARVAAAMEATGIPRAQWQPLVGVTAQAFGATMNNTTATDVGTPFLDLPRIGTTPAVTTGTWQPYASTLVGAGVRQEVFDFGRVAAQAAAADALVEVQKQAGATALLDVTYTVEEAYFAVFAAKGVLKASEDAYARAKVHRDLAEAGVRSGLRPPIELTRADADLARFDAGRIRARGGLSMAQATFAAAVGVTDEALDAAGTAAGPPDMPVLSAAIQEASRRDPRVLQALAQLRAEEERTRAIGAEQRPDLSFTGTISGRAGGAPASSGGVPAGDGWVPDVPNWDVGVVLSWPLFDPGVRAREAASRAAEDVRRQELAQAQFEEVAAIRRAFVGVAIARAALPALQQGVDAARANYAQADARFRAGLGTAVELADAEALRADAEIQLALGVFDLARARAAFGRAIAEGA